MITRIVRALCCVLGLLLLASASPALAQAAYPLLSGVIPAPAASPSPGDYALSLPANFNGATITVYVTTGGQAQAVYTYNAQPPKAPTINVPGGSQVTATVIGGIPSGATSLNSSGASSAALQAIMVDLTSRLIEQLKRTADSQDSADGCDDGPDPTMQFSGGYANRPVYNTLSGTSQTVNFNLKGCGYAAFSCNVLTGTPAGTITIKLWTDNSMLNSGAEITAPIYAMGSTTPVTSINTSSCNSATLYYIPNRGVMNSVVMSGNTGGAVYGYSLTRVKTPMPIGY